MPTRSPWFSHSRMRLGISAIYSGAATHELEDIAIFNRLWDARLQRYGWSVATAQNGSVRRSQVLQQQIPCLPEHRGVDTAARGVVHADITAVRCSIDQRLHYTEERSKMKSTNARKRITCPLLFRT